MVTPRASAPIQFIFQEFCKLFSTVFILLLLNKCLFTVWLREVNFQILSIAKIHFIQGLLTEADKDPVLFGSYHYSAEKGAPSLQYFPVENTSIDQPYQIIELRVESNHGNPRYTCLYRFRVHGNVVKR